MLLKEFHTPPPIEAFLKALLSLECEGPWRDGGDLQVSVWCL